MQLHNANKNPSIPVAHAVRIKETYESISFILKADNYDAHLWHICGNVKVIDLLFDLQDGFTNYCLCLWDSTTSKHYIIKELSKIDKKY